MLTLTNLLYPLNTITCLVNNKNKNLGSFFLKRTFFAHNVYTRFSRTIIFSSNNQKVYKIIKRFYPGGKEFGHAQKLLNSLKNLRKPLMPTVVEQAKNAGVTVGKHTPMSNITHVDVKNNPLPTQNPFLKPLSSIQEQVKFSSSRAEHSNITNNTSTKSFSEISKNVVDDNVTLGLSTDNILHNLYKLPFLCLPISYPLKENMKDYISGLMSMSEHERTILLENSVLGENLREIYITILTKSLFLLSKFKEKEQFLNYYFDNSLSMIPITNLKNNPELYKLISEKKLITVQQHMFNIITGHYKFKYQILKQYCDYFNIETKYYVNEQITSQTFFEVSIIKKVLELTTMKDMPFIQIILINPNKLPPFYDIKESMLATNQPHVDTLIRTCAIKSTKNDIIDIINIYVDVKSYKKNGFGFSSFSVFQPTEKTYYQEINNITTALNNFLNNYKNKTDENYINYLKLNAKIKAIKFANKATTIEEKFSKIYKLLSEAMLNPIFKELKIGLAMPIKTNEAYVEYYNKILKENILKEVTKVNSGKTLEELFPSNYILTKDKQEKIITYYANTLFPQEDAENIKQALLMLTQ